MPAALTDVTLPTNDTGTVPPWIWALTIPLIEPFVVTVPIPVPLGIVSVIVPLVIVACTAVAVTVLLVVVPLLSTTDCPL